MSFSHAYIQGAASYGLHIVIVYYIVLPACAGPATYIQMQYVANIHGSLYMYIFNV